MALDEQIVTMVTKHQINSLKFTLVLKKGLNEIFAPMFGK